MALSFTEGPKDNNFNYYFIIFISLFDLWMPPKKINGIHSRDLMEKDIKDLILIYLFYRVENKLQLNGNCMRMESECN